MFEVGLVRSRQAPDQSTVDVVPGFLVLCFFAHDTPSVEDLTSEIEEKTAASAKLSTEAKNLESDIASKQRSLDEATALRKKQLASFTQEEKELLEAISALKSAVTVLKKHHTDFVQMPHVAKAVQHVMQAHGRMLQGVLTEAQKQAVLSLTQTGSHEAYNPQSGEVFGILEQMLETFQANLKQAW